MLPSQILLSALLALPGVYSWRLLNHAASDCTSGGTFIIGAGTSACLAIDPESPGLLLQSTGDNVRLEFYDSLNCLTRDYQTNQRTCINGEERSSWRAIIVRVLP
jgi:hypothetical protein